MDRIINVKNDILNGMTFPEAGDKLYHIMINDIETVKFKLDMDGVELLPSMFLTPSIGRIIDEKGVDVFKRNVVFKNITTSQANRLRDYVARY